MRNVAPSNRLGPPCNRPVYCWGDLERASDCEAGHIESIVVVFFLRPFALSSMAETPSRIQGRESCRPWNQTPALSLFFVVHRPYDGTDAQFRQFRRRHLNKQQSSNHPIWSEAQLLNPDDDVILLLHGTHWVHATIWEQLGPNQSRRYSGVKARRTNNIETHGAKG